MNPALDFSRPLGHETLRDKVYQRLREAIIAGRFAPGQAITVRALAEAFGTSPTPVREALQRLMAEQVLEGIPNTCYRLPQMTRERFRGLSEMRAALEALAAEKAAADITPAELASLERADAKAAKAAARQNARAFLAANEEFHFLLHRACRVQVLEQALGTLWMQLNPCLHQLVPRVALGADPLSRHAAARAALTRGDGPTAAAALRSDVLEGCALLEPLL